MKSLFKNWCLAEYFKLCFSTYRQIKKDNSFNFNTTVPTLINIRIKHVYMKQKILEIICISTAVIKKEISSRHIMQCHNTLNCMEIQLEG